MHTPLARDLGLEFPIFAFTHCRDVAAAVSKAGGLGVLGVAGPPGQGRPAGRRWVGKEKSGQPHGGGSIFL